MRRICSTSIATRIRGLSAPDIDKLNTLTETIHSHRFDFRTPEKIATIPDRYITIGR